ncbi:MAG: hypothetical protein FWC47_05945 [Oscillospiraceae bacterium]|nr:hypothetical protein [Oscillospiraceae bacterium]
MKKSKYNNPKIGPVKGWNIYVDERGRTVYFDILTKIGYVIDENNQRLFYFFHNRYIIIIFGIILFGDYLLDLKYTIAIGFILIIALELIFRFWYLNKLKMLDNFTPRKKASVLNGLIEDNNPKKTLVMAVLYAAFSVLVVVNAVTQHMGIPLIVLSSLLSLFTAYYSIIHVIALIKMGR